MFKKPFSFEGRIRRSEFWIGAFIFIFGIIICSSSSILGLGFIPLIWFKLAQNAKRCHDRGNSGFFQLIPFNGLWMAFAEGDKGPNQYGENPKAINWGDMGVRWYGDKSRVGYDGVVPLKLFICPHLVSFSAVTLWQFDLNVFVLYQ